MKNFLKRWWVKHNNPEFCRSIIRGTMKRMQQLAHAKGHPISDYYKIVKWVIEQLVQKWYELIMITQWHSVFYFFWRYKYELLLKVGKFFKGGYLRKRFFQKGIFLTFIKKRVFPIVYHVFKKINFGWHFLEPGLVFLFFLCQNIFQDVIVL